MAKIENHKYSIEEAFRECFYVVPDYQREYVWTDKEVHQLLEDINDEIDASSTKEYFIGTILVSPSTQNNHYEVIDGQQRLTTFFLLLCALKHLFKAEPQETTISGLISTSYTDSTGDTKTELGSRLDSIQVQTLKCQTCTYPVTEQLGTEENSKFRQGRSILFRPCLLRHQH